jgi:D-hexose-6-phosphate mutarotase
MAKSRTRGDLSMLRLAGAHSTLEIAPQGAHVTDWTPHDARPVKAGAMADLGEDAWTGMVCVETANAAADARTLAPGDSHVLETVISVKPG